MGHPPDHAVWLVWGLTSMGGGRPRAATMPAPPSRRADRMLSTLHRVRQGIREDGEYRLGRYGSFWDRFALAPWRWAVALCLFHESWSLHLFCLWVRLGPATTPDVAGAVGGGPAAAVAGGWHR